MASVLTPGTSSPPQINFYPKLAEEFLIQNPFLKPNVTEFHQVFEGIKGKQQIAFLNRFGKSSLKWDSCGANPTGGLTASEKEWDPIRFKVEKNQCFADFANSFLQWGLANGVAAADLTNYSYFETFIFDLLQDIALEDVLRIAWLSDTTYTAGDFTNGAADLPYYNEINGFWQQIVASIGAGSGAVRAYTITENSASTIAAQMDLSSTADKQKTAYNVYRSLFEKADSRLISASNKVIISTRSLVDNYAGYLESQGNDVSFERIENGFTSLRYRDTQIYSFDLLDRNIQADFKTGSPETYDLPHRAILTTRDNLGVAFDALSAVSSISAFYDPKDEDYTAKLGYMMDAKVIWDYLVAAAY